MATRLFMAAAPILAALASAGAAAQPELTVMTGAGGVFRGGAFVPVLVILNNDDADRNGRLEAALPTAGGYVNSAVRELPLPRHSRKAAFLYVPSSRFTAAGFRDELRVRYVEDGRPTAEVSDRLMPREADAAIVCGAPRLPSAVSALLDERQPEFLPVFMRIETLAHHHCGLEMFDAIIMAPVPGRALETETARALRDWVLRGGTLVVAANRLSEAFLQGGLADMLPFLPEGTAVRTVEALGGPVPVALGRRRGGEVLLGDEGTPLVIRQGFGLGSVTCFAIDPEGAEMDAWAGAGDLWRDILGAVTIGRREDNAMGAWAPPPSQTLQETVEGPVDMGLRLGMVLLLTLIYAAAVGPFDFLLIRKLRRPALTWVTFPLMVAGFTALAYAGARFWMGGEVTALHARRTLVHQRAGWTVRSDISSIFVPAAGRYRLEHEDGLVLRPFGDDWSESRPFTLYLEGDYLEQELPIWKRWYYRASQTGELAGAPFRMTVRMPGDPPAGGGSEDARLPAVTITNETADAYRIRHVVYGDALYVFRSRRLAAGETTECDLAEGVRTVWKQEPDALPGWGVASVSYAGGPLGGLWGDLSPVHAGMREFDLRDALRRGAVAVQLESVEPVAPCPLWVDGRKRSERGTHYVQLLEYINESL